MHLLWRTGAHYHCLRGNTPHPVCVCVCVCVKREDVCVNDDNGERWSHLTGFKLHSITTSLPCKGKSNQYVRHILSLTTSSPLSQSHFLTLSLSHPLTPSFLIPSHLHPLLPTYLHLFQRNMFCQTTAHTARVLLTNVNYTESDEKHLCLQHAMYTSTNA